MASNLLDHTLLSAHDPKTGRYDARRLAATLEITSREMAAVVGYTPTGLGKNPASPRLQPKLRELVGLLNRLRELLDGRMDLVRIWLKAPHPLLEDVTPLSYLETGKLDAVETLVYMMETGQPGQMLFGNELEQTLTNLAPTPWTGVAYRLIPAQFAGTALSSIGSLRRGGRYNPRETFEALYLADTPLTALQEINLIRVTDEAILSAKSSPRLLLSVEVTVSMVLDLTTPQMQSALSTNLQELTGSWLAMNAAGHLAPTQVLGTAAYNLGLIEALRAPSAQDSRATNLVIFPDRLRQGSWVRVYDDSGLIDAMLTSSV